MTHKDIYTKFMIEYDKANVTSSYPSLTEYEVATVLDKAYNALIAQKITGNNVRRVAFEYDTKAIEDIRPLLVTKELQKKGRVVENEQKFKIPEELLYYIEGFATYTNGERELVIPVNHQIARRFKVTNSNLPWVKLPVSYIEGDTLYVLIDKFKHDDGFSIEGTYIKKPNPFVKPIGDPDEEEEFFGFSDDTARDYATLSQFDYNIRPGGIIYLRDMKSNVSSRYEFECNETVAEELISLAVAFALENVESSRLNSKLNMRGLEA